MSSRQSALRIIVTGLVGAYPIGGVAWDYFQYPIGLARLGHEVVYYENTWMWPYHPIENTPVETASYSVDYIARFFRNYAPELAQRWHYRHLASESYGLTETEFESFARTADLCLNVSSASTLPAKLGIRCLRVFLDTDPGYNQIVLSERPQWSSNVDRWAEEFRNYDRYLTYAENIGEADCPVPTLGVDWITTRMPIILDLWRDPSTPADSAPWSTIMTWNGFPGPLIYNDCEYGSKDVEFARIASLPGQIKNPLKIALGGAGAPAQSLVEQGWIVVDGPNATLTPERYREFIKHSRGEISSAKNVYVAMRTGWFSCRTGCYLASGRPAVVQDTGFSKYIPVGQGVIAFNTLEEAKAALETAEENYTLHAAAAREIAAEYFRSDNVLARMLDAIFAKA
jgi:hypothetical protein